MAEHAFIRTIPYNVHVIFNVCLEIKYLTYNNIFVSCLRNNITIAHKLLKVNNNYNEIVQQTYLIIFLFENNVITVTFLYKK